MVQFVFDRSEAPVYPSDEWQRAFMRRIEADIVEWKLAYYNGDAGRVGDSQYDLWFRNLLFLEKKYPHLKSANSPTDLVGAPVSE